MCDVAGVGQRGRSVDRPGHDVDDVDGVTSGLFAELDARQLHQVVDRPGDAVRLGDHPF